MPTDTDRDIDARVAELDRVCRQHGSAAARELMARRQSAIVFWLDANYSNGTARQFLQDVVDELRAADRASAVLLGGRYQ